MFPVKTSITLYGWPVSPYTDKVRAYLAVKGVPHRIRRPSAPELAVRIKKAVGSIVMPTVRLGHMRSVRRPLGRLGSTWLQDSSDIIDRLEADYPEHSIEPNGPRQQVVARLLELFGDEWLCIPAIHYRWNYEENAEFALREFGRYALPGAPEAVQRRLATPFVKKMASYRKVLGIHPHTTEGVERFTETLLALLDTHFSAHDYLLGDRPCLGDFAFFGPIHAHLYRDPATRALFRAYPSLTRWVERLDRPQQTLADCGPFLADDAIPDSLLPILGLQFSEQYPYLEALVVAINAYCSEHPEARRVPRALGHTDVTIGGLTGERRLITFAQWMAQRPLAIYAQASTEEQASIDALLQEVGGQCMHLPIDHPFVRRHFKMELANPPSSAPSRSATSSAKPKRFRYSGRGGLSEARRD